MNDGEDFDLFELDPAKLDTEWLRQPKLYHHHAVELADARAGHARAEAKLDVVVAELDRDIRANPQGFNITLGGRGLTEEQVKKTIILQPQHKRAVQDVVDAAHAVDIAKALVEALDHRKRALENLVQLEGRDYFATPRAPTGVASKSAKERQADQAFGVKKRHG